MDHFGDAFKDLDSAIADSAKEATDAVNKSKPPDIAGVRRDEVKKIASGGAALDKVAGAAKSTERPNQISQESFKNLDAVNVDEVADRLPNGYDYAMRGRNESLLRTAATSRGKLTILRDIVQNLGVNPNVLNGVSFDMALLGIPEPTFERTDDGVRANFSLTPQQKKVCVFRIASLLKSLRG